ncbi:putative high-affinity glucose transporter [Xylariaceae sp. FL1019]|nr:putative high-affinity glucose transporter [Xylariaceae sp. FL1019]
MDINAKRAEVDKDVAHLEHAALAAVAGDESFAEAYGSTGVRGMMESPYVSGAAALASLGGFSFGYDQGVISIILTTEQFLEVFPRARTPFGSSLMTSLLLLGAFVGCLAFPYLADRISRKYAIVVVVVIFTVGAVIQTAAMDYATICAGRAIGGIGTGTLALGAPLYISEVAPPNMRGTLLVLESICIVSGVVIAFWITYGTMYIQSDAAFRIPFALQIIPALLLGVGILFFPFSPRWLAMVNRNDECLTSLAKLRGLPVEDERVQREYRSIIIEVEFQRAVQERRHPGRRGIRLEVLQWLDLFRRKTWRRAVVALGVSFFQQFMGVNAFIYYAPTLFRQLGQSDSLSLILSGIFNILQLVTVFVAFIIIDKVGRRWLAIVGAAGTSVSYIVIAILSGLYEDSWLEHTAEGWVAVTFAFLFILFFGVSYSPLGWALPTEVFPTSVRSKGVALSNCVNWLSNFTVAIITPPLIASARFGTYIFFAILCIGALLWALFLLPETKGKTLEEMDEVFGDTSGQEETEIMAMILRTNMAQRVGKAEVV